MLLCLLSACSHTEETWIEDFAGLDPKTSFVPFGVEDNTLEDFMANIPQEDEDEQTRATSSDLGNSLKNIFSVKNASKIRSYVGGYWSIDQDGKPVRLSGRIVVPKHKKVKRIMIYNHYTITANAEAPSQSLPFESMIAELGIAMIQPDYIGYGLTADRVPPYLIGWLHARNVLDMYYAALPFLECIGASPEEDDVYVYGFSQGAAGAMFVTRDIEVAHTDLKARITFAGSGPYDICATYDKLVEDDNTDFPYVVPLIIQGLDVGARLNLNYAQFFRPLMLDHLDEWINSKRYVGSYVTRLVGSTRLSSILTDDAMNKRCPDMSALYRAMIDNSLTYDNSWYPTTPIYAFHSFDDNVVPIINSYKMVEKYQSRGNLILNVGHYGKHTMCGLHFMYSVYNYLKENEDL